jgi:hypothetical protein
MKLSSFATNALATTRATFKGLADAAVTAGENEKPETVEKETAAPKGVRLGTVLDAYA